MMFNICRTLRVTSIFYINFPVVVNSNSIGFFTSVIRYFVLSFHSFHNGIDNIHIDIDINLNFNANKTKYIIQMFKKKLPVIFFKLTD